MNAIQKASTTLVHEVFIISFILDAQLFCIYFVVFSFPWQQQVILDRQWLPPG